MFKRHLWPAIQWIYGSILQICCYLARPFRRRWDSTELPLASPVVPSTPSFIQSQEPNFNIDAMRIFQLNNGTAHTSHMARNKVAVQQMRTAPPNINRIASVSSTDPSPGFSLLTDVVDNLVTPVEADSLYSSPPSSPSSSLHTPCIVVSGPMADVTYHDDARLSLDFGLRREPRLAELGSISQSELPLPRHISPDVHGLAKRRNFKGPPIITNISRDFLPFPPTRLSQGIVTPTDWHTQQNLSRPKSALAVVTDFVRASTNMPARNVSRETLVISPESQTAFIQSSPFSAQSESFFVDDHLTCPLEFDIHDLGIYADASSTLNLQVPRRKRTVIVPEPLRTSLCMATNDYGKPILAKGVTDTTRKKTRTLSGVSQLSKVGISTASMPDSSFSPASVVPASVPSHGSDTQEGSSPGLSMPGNDSDSKEQHILPDVEVDEEWTVSSRLSLYESLIFPFSLEDSISWKSGQDFEHHSVEFVGLNGTLLQSFGSSEESVLGAAVHTDDVDEVDAVGLLEYDPLQVPGTISVLFTLDRNLSSSVNVANSTRDVLVRGGTSVAASPKDCRDVLSSPAVDGSFVAGSTPLSTLGIPTDSLLDVRNDGRCEENCTAYDLRETSFRRVDDVLDGSFVSSGDSSILLPVSESRSGVGSSQTLSSAMSMSPIGCNFAKNVSVSVNNRRARRVGIYGPIFPPIVTPDSEDTLLSNPEQSVDQSTSERRKSPSQRESRHGSALRPLVLPMRVAIRDLNTTGDRSFEGASNTLLQSNRTTGNIGFPPPFPLPELPLYGTSTSTIVASVLPGFEGSDAFQQLPGISARSLTVPEPLSTYSTPELEGTYPDSDGEDSTHAVNWGVAF